LHGHWGRLMEPTKQEPPLLVGGSAGRAFNALTVGECLLWRAPLTDCDNNGFVNIRAAHLALLDLYLRLFLLSVGRLRQGYGKNSVFKLCLDLAGVDAIGHTE
jgi:hypothetical protein